ncbi:MAG: class II fructose-bisphosphate aldolase [candidate division Zixibacteria bacterium]|nr:class II fructose-bisphosphate aldolase [candidate division Zixibacteria bacterium]
MAYSKLLDRRLESTKGKLGSGSKVCLLNGRDIFHTIRDKEMIMMACNVRIKHVVPGIMKAAQELDAIVGFELAKSEGHIDGGYTGQPPQVYYDMLVDYAEKTGFEMPFFIHGDHITVKNTSDKEIDAAKALIDAELKAGYTCYAIDASFNEHEDNIRITLDLAKEIMAAGWGLEVEVGEVKSTGQTAEVTTVEEGSSFINALFDNGIRANLLAINNGSKHGNYLEGEEINIDLTRTGDIYQAIKDKDVRIAQHGITGTPLNIIGKFAEYGIRKGNVGTQWQNIAHAGLPKDLMEQMKQWAESEGKNIKMATKPFKKEIDSVSAADAQKIADEAYQVAHSLLTAFRADGSAAYLNENIGN